jgi:hypothetical protein
MGIKDDANKLVAILREKLPKTIDGRDAITAMRDEGSTQWRQMEWIGFWFEHFVETKIAAGMGITKGPTYGNTTFDTKISQVWDLKVHPDAKPQLILNDQEAFKACIEQNGGLGFIILEGQAEFDSSGDFKRWHDILKGGTSAYEAARIMNGKPSRKRKVSFTPKRMVALYFPNLDSVREGLRDGWLGEFQENMSNSNGKPRRAKYLLKAISKVPNDYVVLDEVL